jgi:hypothetical protein
MDGYVFIDPTDPAPFIEKLKDAALNVVYKIDFASKSQLCFFRCVAFNFKIICFCLG